VCIASSNGGTTSQDLKTGYLVGATPRKQQWAILVGALTSAVFIGGGVPKDFIQITATSVCAIRGGGEASPHRAAIQITTDQTVFGGLGGAGVNTEAISWGKEAVDGDNVMVFADLTIALPLLCQGLLEHYGPHHHRPTRGQAFHS
jgi:deoxyhypusine synthase